MAEENKENKFIPDGQPLALEQLTDLTEDGEVLIRRSDVEKAMLQADESLKPYLQAKEYGKS